MRMLRLSHGLGSDRTAMYTNSRGNNFHITYTLHIKNAWCCQWNTNCHVGPVWHTHCRQVTCPYHYCTGTRVARWAPSGTRTAGRSRVPISTELAHMLPGGPRVAHAQPAGHVYLSVLYRDLRVPISTRAARRIACRKTLSPPVFYDNFPCFMTLLHQLQFCINLLCILQVNTPFCNIT